MEELLFEFV